MSELISLREKLNEFDKDSLKFFAAELDIKGTSKLKKVDLIEKIADSFLSTEVLFDRLALLDDREMKLLEEGSIKQIEINDNDYETHETACRLNEMEFAVFRINGEFSTLSDVWDIYQKNIAGDGFESYRKKASWVRKCIHWADRLCGVVPKDVFLKIVNTRKSLRMTEDELIEIYNRIPVIFKDLLLLDGSFVSTILVGNKDYFEGLLEDQADKPYYVPTEKEIEELFASDSLLSKKSYQNLFKYLVNDMKFGRQKAKELLQDLWDKIVEEDDMQGTIEWFLNNFSLQNEKDANNLMGQFREVVNNTNRLQNRGFTPSALPKLGYTRGQMPTIVPGSSRAAEALADAEPQLSQMGFKLDLDGNSKEIPAYEKSASMNGTLVRTTRKVYPNDPCPCGSGKKFKKCCGR